MVQHGQDKMTLLRTRFKHSRGHFGPWSIRRKVVHFGPFGSTNGTGSTPDYPSPVKLSEKSIHLLGVATDLYPVLPFLVFFSVKGKDNLKINKDLLSLSNPKIHGKKGKRAQKTRNSSQEERKQGNPKKQGEEGQGIYPHVCLGIDDVPCKAPPRGQGLGSR